MVPVCFGRVRQKCLDEQKQRRLRATKKISTFIGTFVVCFTPYVVTRWAEMFNILYVFLFLFFFLCVCVHGNACLWDIKHHVQYHQNMWRFPVFWITILKKNVQHQGARTLNYGWILHIFAQQYNLKLSSSSILISRTTLPRLCLFDRGILGFHLPCCGC